MNCTPEMLRLYAVTDRAWVGRQTLPQQVEAALKGGATMIQLREKQLDDAALLAEAREICALCKAYHVPFILNDNVPLAKLCDADGVHVGQEDLAAAEARRLLGPGKIVGVSAHNVAEAQKALADGADYLGCGAMFTTHTKKNVHVITRELLTEVCASVPIPVVAIGGIHKDNLLTLAGTGIAGVALVTAIFGAEDIAKECTELREMVAKLYQARPLRRFAPAPPKGEPGAAADRGHHLLPRNKIHVRSFVMKTAFFCGGAGIQFDLAYRGRRVCSGTFPPPDASHTA